MVQVNLTGKQPVQYQTYLVNEDAYDAVVDSVDGEFQTVKGGNFPEKQRLIVRWKLGKGEVLPMFLNPRVSCGGTNREGKTFNPTSSYVLLDAAGLLPDFSALVNNRQEIGDAEMVEFIGKRLVGRKARVLVRSAKKNTPQQYSIVKEIISFV